MYFLYSKENLKTVSVLKKAFFNIIINGIKDNRSVELRNFGRFSVKVIKENKNARNPLTGKKIAVKEKKSIYFKMSKELRKKINENRVLN